MQPKPEPRHTHIHRAAQSGWVGYRQSAHTNTKTPQDPSQERRGAAETRALAHPPTPHTPARRGGVQAERAHKHTHTPTPQPGVAGYNGARTQTQTHPNNPARIGGAQPKPEPKHTHRHCTRQPRVAGYKRSAHTKKHTPTPEQGLADRSRSKGPRTPTHTAHPSYELRGTIRAGTETHTHRNTLARSGRTQPKPRPKHSQPHRTPEPGVAGRSRNARPSTPNHTAHPSQEWRGTSGARTQRDTHTRTPQPGVAGRSRNPSPSTLNHTAHPSQERQGTSKARTQTHTHPNTPARSGGAQPKPEPKQTHPRRAPQPGVAGSKRGAHTNTRRHQRPSQGVRGAAETRAQAHTPTPHIQTRSGGVPAERAHKHTQTPTPQPEMAERSRNPRPSTHTQAAQPSH